MIGNKTDDFEKDENPAEEIVFSSKNDRTIEVSSEESVEKTRSVFSSEQAKNNNFLNY